MARVEIDLTAQTADPVTSAVKVAPGATVQVNVRNTNGTSGAAATVYTTPDLGTTIAGGTITADTAGHVEGWVEPGKYNLTISGTGITTYTQAWDAVPNDDVAYKSSFESTFSMYKAVANTYHVRADALTAATYVLAEGSVAPLAVTAAGAGLAVFHLEPVDFTATGRTTFLRLKASLLTNAVAPTVNFTLGLYPVATVAGAAATVSITLGAVITGTTVAFTTPGASNLFQGVSTDVSAATIVAGYYVIGLVVSGASAASSAQAIAARLQVRQV